jgi:predicted ribosome quality control (RQC) complex YloA/Tae2 family protein
MLNLSELERIAPLLDGRLAGQRLQSIVQPDATSVALTFYGGSEDDAKGARSHLLLSCHPSFARVSELERAPRGLREPPAFARYLRKHLVGGRCRGVSILDGDRQLAISLDTLDGRRTLVLSIFGRRSNLLVFDEAGCIASGLRPLADTRPELSIGDAWASPASRGPVDFEDRFSDAPDDALLAVIEAHYVDAEDRDAAASLHRLLAKALRKELKTLDRKLEKVERELEAAQRDTDLERKGQLLKSVLARVKKGDETAVASDFESGEKVEIGIDPTLSPVENLEALFKRYRKALRVLTRGGAQQDAVQGERDKIASQLAEVEALPDDPSSADALAEIAARPGVARLVARGAPGKRRVETQRKKAFSVGGREVPAKFVPRRYRTAGGLEIWVGRSAAANDHLSIRLARGKDLFFHLDGAPGSHVILRTEGRDDPPSEALLDACELAVHYSKQKSASRADVHVVPIKNVRKPKGAKPGLVTVHGGKSVHLRRTASRLERVLASRIEP